MEAFEPAFAELSDSMADLEANFMHLQLMHESLARFSENFASFLYGLNMNAFCVDFPEVCLLGLAYCLALVDQVTRRLFQIHFVAHKNRRSNWVRIKDQWTMKKLLIGITGKSTNSERFRGEIDGETTFL